MTRAVLALLALLLLAPAASAQTAAPPSVWTVHTTVRAEVHQAYAVVHVIADIANRGPDPEFPFRVTIPDDAYITGFAITRDGQTYEARVAPRDEARAQYDQTKQAQQTGGLVEKQRHASVYSYLVNVANFTSVRAELTYERLVPADRGAHNLGLEAPVSGFGRDTGATFDVTLDDGGALTDAWSAPAATPRVTSESREFRYDVGPRSSDASTPLLVGWTLASTGGEGALYVSNGSFVHVFRAPPETRTMPLDMALVLAVSGSMSGEKIAQMQDAAKQLVAQLHDADRLALVSFSSDASPAWSGWRAMDAEGRAQAAREIDSLVASGGTNIGDALGVGFGDLSSLDGRKEDARWPALVLLTDGQPTQGTTDRAQLRELATRANQHGAQVFAIGFGADADFALLHQLASDGNGTAIRVAQGSGAEVDLRRFLTALATPALKDVHVSYDSGAQAFRAGAPVLFGGSELVVSGSYDIASGAPTATVTALGPDGPRSYALPGAQAKSAGAWVARMAAYARIRDLEERIDAEGATAAWVDELTKLATANHFVTRVTSLVVSLPQQAPREVAPVSGPAMAPQAMDASSTSGWAAAPMATATPSSTAATLSGRAVAPAAGSSSGVASAPTPDAKVPGPALALVLVAAAALALGLKRN